MNVTSCLTKVSELLRTEVDEADLLFSKFSSFLLAGKSGSGKTRFLFNFLKHHERLGHEGSYSHVVVCYREDQDGLYDKLAHFLPATTRISLFQGSIPSDLYDGLDPHESGSKTHHLIIIDDLFVEAFSSLAVQQLFISGRHKKVTVFLTTQNLFPPGAKHARTISLNACYIVLFRSRDKNQIKILARQLLGSDKKGFLEAAVDDAIKLSGYLLIDCSPQQEIDEIRYRTSVFQAQPVVYIPKQLEAPLFSNI